MKKIKFYINKWIKGIQYKKFCNTYSRQEASCRDCPYYNNAEMFFCEKEEYTGSESCYTDEDMG